MSMRRRRAAGRIETIAVREGDDVAGGDVLFVLEASQQQAQYDAALARADAAEAQVAAAEANLANLKTGARPEELQVTQASLMQAEANLALAQQNFSRAQDLFARGNVPKSQLDQAQASLDAANATVVQLKAQLAVAELPARDDQIAARQQTSQWRRRLRQRPGPMRRPPGRCSTTARSWRPRRDGSSGCISRSGEVVGAGTSGGVDCAASGALKIKFYVNEADRPGFASGRDRGRQLRRVRGWADGDDRALRVRPAVHAADHLLARRAAAGWCS